MKHKYINILLVSIEHSTLFFLKFSKLPLLTDYIQCHTTLSKDA